MEQPIVSFTTAAEWDKWLAKNHAKSDGVWLRIYKKDSGVETIYYPEALDEALCYGWIDGIKKSYDTESFLQRFTPRRTKSIWSQMNTKHIDRLTAAGKMKPAGIKEVEAAKADGRWEKAYASGKNAEIPEDFLNALKKNKKAKAFYETLNKQNQYVIYFRLHSAVKPETRAKRLAAILEKLEKNEKFQ
ncbi:bacteriocin-protection protein, YdeI/OmpD-associated family [Chitinophaga silvatica]|uniref:Bacteriocin-protection protein, YdeI/OmpD-associated family n=1 Tax=Chitinophaga silvatica TaxID=2282649 RepID=A0A3E1Y917_9BACT|nr:YdeI/OmpD-associated family protein [Chitinophaga silvatica]RFS21841.1 bacteriocin-protection protein, YdeI/OmpD-associated family [Chitinophaga silvatica]